MTRCIAKSSWTRLPTGLAYNKNSPPCGLCSLTIRPPAGTFRAMKKDQLPESWANLDSRLATLYAQATAGLYDLAEPVHPPHEHRLRAFEMVAPADVKVCLVGMDPYPTPGHAMGLSFSVPEGTRPLPPTLRNIAKEFESDVGTPLLTTDFTYLAEQGILFANAALSVAGKPGAHMARWAAFTEAWMAALQAQDRPCVWILWGNDARAFKPLITGARQRIIEGCHPSPLAAYRGFFGSKPFSKCNALLCELGEAPICWSGIQ